MSKSDYRSFFAECKSAIKIVYFLRQIGVSQTAFSLFMRGEEHDYVMSLDTCKRLYDAICEWCENVA